MALEITSLGATVRWAFESSSGVRPSAGFTVLPDVNQAPEQDLSIETIDVSNITDYVTRYAPGRQDPGGDQAFTLNHTDAVITAWDSLYAEAQTKLASGLSLWFEYRFPNATKSYYWSGIPQKLGTSGIEQNALDTIPAHVVLTGWAGWQTKSSALSADKSTLSLTVGGANGTVTLSNVATSATAVSSNTAVATASVSTSTVTVVPVAAGNCTITITDANGDIVYVTVAVAAS